MLCDRLAQAVTHGADGDTWHDGSFFMMQSGITDINGQGASVGVCDQAYPFQIRRLLAVLIAISSIMFSH